MLNSIRFLGPSLLAFLLLAGCSPSNAPLARTNPLPDEESTGNPNVPFGMPAAADLKSRDAFLIERPQYVLSYNAEQRRPNWVCWRLRQEDIGKAARSAFEPDPDLPAGIAKVKS